LVVGLSLTDRSSKVFVSLLFTDVDWYEPFAKGEQGGIGRADSYLLDTQVGIEEELVAVALVHTSVVAYESRLVVDDKESLLPDEDEVGCAFEHPIT
jgi:hypothetical protein